MRRMGLLFYHHPEWLNPFKPLGTERSPYLPLEGEKICIAMAVNADVPPVLKLKVVGAKAEEQVGDFVRQEKDRWFYKFLLPDCAYGKKVQYWFEASGCQSDVYSFSAARKEDIRLFPSITEDDECLQVETGHAALPHFHIGFVDGRLLLSQDSTVGSGVVKRTKGSVVYSDNASACRVELNQNAGSLNIYGITGALVAANMKLTVTHTMQGLQYVTFRYATQCKAVYGLGERFDSVNHLGRAMETVIFEKFTNQGRAAYLPIPFYYTDSGHGVFIDTLCRVDYDFGTDGQAVFVVGARIGIDGKMPDIHLFFGTPREIVGKYTGLAAKPALPPRWAFGLWISANRWNCQRHIEEQLDKMEQLGYPATAVVIEAWSDELTFYIWNDAQYEPKAGASAFCESEFTFPAQGRWPDPKGMIERLHERGIQLILWQIPLLKAHGGGECSNQQHDNDIAHATETSLCVKNGDTPYRIPDFWFGNSLLPDFTSSEAENWWFSKRKYLLDMGVDGFKTDGGEFIYSDSCAFSDGSTGVEMKNGYSQAYVSAYSHFVGRDRILFSRAGTIGAAGSPMHWAGDQQSTWQEMKSVLKAGLSLGMSGVPFWAFDIGGFAGPLPTAELYIRSTQMAALSPVMQWHSEPAGGQFSELLASTGGVNDRSPWNIARASGDNTVMDISLFYARLHFALLPYLFSEAQKCCRTGLPLMRHLALDYPDDTRAVNIADQYMLGDILVAPVTVDGVTSREVWLPNGRWMDLWTGIETDGGISISASAPIGRLPLYIRQNCAVLFSLDIPKPAAGALQEYTLIAFGMSGHYEFIDGSGKDCEIAWTETGCNLNGADTESRICRVATLLDLRLTQSLLYGYGSQN